MVPFPWVTSQHNDPMAPWSATPSILGWDNEGRKERRFFKHLPDAETHQRTQNANPLIVGALLERKTEFLYCH